MMEETETDIPEMLPVLFGVMESAVSAFFCAPLFPREQGAFSA
jgi:hypothetical protein